MPKGKNSTNNLKEVGGLISSDMKTYCKATVINPTSFWLKGIYLPIDKYIAQKQTLVCMNLIYSKRKHCSAVGNKGLFKILMLSQLVIRREENKS